MERGQQSVFTYQSLWYVVMIHSVLHHGPSPAKFSTDCKHSESFMLTCQSKACQARPSWLLWRLDKQRSEERPTSYVIHPQMDSMPSEPLVFISPFGKLIDWWINSILQIEFYKTNHCLHSLCQRPWLP